MFFVPITENTCPGILNGVPHIFPWGARQQMYVTGFVASDGHGSFPVADGTEEMLGPRCNEVLEKNGCSRCLAKQTGNCLPKVLIVNGNLTILPMTPQS